MPFDVLLGIAVAAVGIAILVCAVAHPSSQSFVLTRLFAWPRTDQDRTDLVLSGFFYMALGAFLALLATDVTRALLLVPVPVLLVTGIALGVRHRAT